MTKEFKDAIPQLNIEVLENGCIRLESESIDDNYIVDIHPVHLRYIAEKMGLIAETSATDAELLRTERGQVADLKRTLDRYKRALLHIKVRAEQLHDNIFNCSRRGHEDLSVEVAQSAALADFAEHICVEFEDDFTVTSGHSADKMPAAGGQIPSIKASPEIDSRQLAMEV